MSETLSKDEAAYFESGGESGPAAETETTTRETTTEREPPESEAAEPEAGAETETEGQPRAKTVPHQAFHQERERRKAVETEFERFKGSMQARFEALQAGLAQAMPQAQQQAPQVPEFASDPQAHIDARLRAFEAQAAELKAWRDQQAQQTAQQQQFQQLAAWGSASEAAFEKETPDYKEAIKHLTTARTAQLKALGVPEQEIGAAIRNDVLQIALAAKSRNGNFAETLYQTARAMGYSPAAAQESADEGRIETIERGQRLAATVGGSGGAAPARLTADRIANMSDREFEKFMSSKPDELRRLMGG